MASFDPRSASRCSMLGLISLSASQLFVAVSVASRGPLWASQNSLAGLGTCSNCVPVLLTMANFDPRSAARCPILGSFSSYIGRVINRLGKIVQNVSAGTHHVP
jgi:hypothetical protein